MTRSQPNITQSCDVALANPYAGSDAGSEPSVQSHRPEVNTAASGSSRIHVDRDDIDPQPRTQPRVGAPIGPGQLFQLGRLSPRHRLLGQAVVTAVTCLHL